MTKTKATMFDANDKEMYRGSQVTFWSARTRAQMDGKVLSERALGQMVEVQIDGDPFPVMVPMKQLTNRGEGMPAATTERPSRKEMRRLAKTLGVEGWESLSTESLWEAIKEAEGPAKSNGKKKKSKKSKGKAKVAKPDNELNDEEWEASPRKKAKKDVKTKTKASKTVKKSAPAKSKPKAAPKPESKKPAKEVAENGNPFRPGTNLALITDELIKGGSRQKMIDRLLKKIDLHPWAKKPKDLDLNFEMDKRVLLAAHTLKNKFGFTIKLEGRGPGEGTIKATAPSGKSAAKKATKTGPKVKSKRTSKKVVAKTKKSGKRAA